MTALASTRVLGANDTLRVGVIGAGGRMRTVLDSADKSGIPFQIVAVSDVYGPRRDEVKERSNGIATTHLDYHEVLAKDIDAVLIASPDHWHVRMACDALAAGKDVYLEKPVTHTIEEGSALAKAVRSSKQVLQCGMQQRSWTHFRNAVDLIQAGSLGRVTQVRTFWWQNYNVAAWKPKPINAQELDWKMWLGGAPDQPFSEEKYYRWRWFWNFGGGGMTDLFTHWIDVVHMFTGKDIPCCASAAGGVYRYRDGRTAPDTINVLLEYADPNPFTATFEATLVPGIRGEAIEMCGTEGRLWIDRSRYEFYPVGAKEPSEVVKAEVMEGVRDSLTQDHVNNFLDCVKSRAKPNGDVLIGHRSAQASHLGNISYEQKRRIPFDTTREEILPV